MFSPSTTSLRKKIRTQAGSTLVEAMMACALVALFLAGLYDMNWRALAMLKSSLDVTSATELTTNVAELIRTATWQQITDPTYISGTLLPKSTTTGHLPNVVQQIDVNPYPVPSGYGSPPVGAETVEVKRAADGTITTAYSGNGKLSTENSVQIDITVTWYSTFKNISHTRSVRLFASQYGVLGQN